MIKLLLAIGFILSISQVNAQDDRYFNSSASYTHNEKVVYAVVKSSYCKNGYCRARKISKARWQKEQQHLERPQRPAGLHFLADAAQAAVIPVRRISEAVIHGGRPSGCPSRAWCGCFLSKHLGLNRRDLWLARNWARVGSAASPSAGTVVVWRHHVGQIKAVQGNRILVLSGNDGRRIRERWRTMAGVIAVRRI